MRRHSIIARLGPSDTGPVTVVQTDSLRTEIRFVDGYQRLGFGVGQMIQKLTACSLVPSETAADLVILAATVTAADTRISRAADAQDSWTREIDLYIPVQDLARWTVLTTLISRMLNFLTGDRWRLFFRERHVRHWRFITHSATRVGPAFTSVCLFSGGLDSFIGAINLLAAGQTPLLVSHYGDKSTSSQELCAHRLASVYGDLRPRHVRANVRFDKNDFAHPMGEESTTRGRSFLFFALASLAASGLRERPVIYVPENGLISLNVPLDPLRVGAWSTRTTHPFYMARWQEMLDGLEIAATLENPYRFKTKGEMLRACANADLVRRHVGDTISCSSITKARWLGLPPEHCGFCVPCLIRRAAVTSAFGDDPTTYTITIADLWGRPLDSKGAEGEHVRSFQMMARRLAQRPALAQILVHKPGPLSDYPDADVTEYADVFRRGIEEVDTVTGRALVRPA
jgi:7-cyano-7-deazaguanine synthase in queuosine biosynthesis